MSVRDHTAATDEKFFIEDRQRKEAKQREEEGVELVVVSLLWAGLTKLPRDPRDRVHLYRYASGCFTAQYPDDDTNAYADGANELNWWGLTLAGVRMVSMVIWARQRIARATTCCATCFGSATCLAFNNFFRHEGKQFLGIVCAALTVMHFRFFLVFK